ncbi:MAG: hypothetical protein JO202_11585 [Ktedonobacteraceae bacterium]|nr:hypothetical protein [Ktedonobacteraceae bacterium]
MSVTCLQRAWIGEHGDRKGSPLRSTLRPPRHLSSSGSGSAPAMQKIDAHPAISMGERYSAAQAP